MNYQTIKDIYLKYRHSIYGIASKAFSKNKSIDIKTSLYFFSSKEVNLMVTVSILTKLIPELDIDE